MFGICYVLFSRSSGLNLIPLFALYGLSIAATDGISKAYLVQSGSNIPKGTLIGAQYFVIGLTTLAGNLLAGLIWAKFSAEAMLVFGGVLALASAGCLAILVFKGKQRA